MFSNRLNTTHPHSSWLGDGVTVEIRRLSPAEFTMLAPDLVDIYLEAMGYDPSIRQQRINVWRREIMWEGFTAIAAVEQEDVVGVAYGFLGTRERWCCLLYTSDAADE